MQLNVLNELAEAMKALDGEKGQVSDRPSQATKTSSTSQSGHSYCAKSKRENISGIQAFFRGRRLLPFGRSHLRLPSGPAGIRTTTGSLVALASKKTTTSYEAQTNDVLRAVAAIQHLSSPMPFFPSNALWLPPGRSTCFQACCK